MTPLVLIVTLIGTPRALPRPRFVGAHQHPVSLTGHAKAYAQALERAARAVVLKVGVHTVQQEFAGHALAVSILWQFPTMFRERWGQPHTFRPDKDNLEKMTLDCLQRAGALGGDDSRVALGSTAKLWGSAGLLAARVELADRAPQATAKGKKDKLSIPPPWLV